MFGGGSSTRQWDEEHLIRGSAIRGHLRFWWRATRGAQCESVRELRRREDKVWGSSDVPSPVTVVPRVIEVGQSVSPANPSDPKKPNPSFPGYALFPFRRTEPKNGNPEVPESKGREKIRFDLTVSFPGELADDVEAALWAWANFGGVGARTRRGCGALYCPAFAPPQTSSGADIISWFVSGLRERAPTAVSTEQPWPVLSSASLLVGRAESRQGAAQSAWKNAVKLLQDYRQGVGVGRNQGQQSGSDRGFHAGRSRWPEADSIRRIANIRDGRHANSITTEFNVFPRSEFGLPIVFHFKGVRRDGDPDRDSTLYPAVGDHQRMASPLILRPLFCKPASQDAPRSCFPIILLLQAPRVTAVRLDPPPLRVSNSFGVRDARLEEYPESPLSGRAAHGSAIQGFLHYAREKGGFV